MGEKEAGPKCCGQVYDKDGSWGHKYRPCTRTATGEHEGKPYCGQHHPGKRDGRRHESYVRFRAQRDRERAEADRQSLALSFVGDVPIERLRELAASGGLRAILERLERAGELPWGG